jgi:hypothetical protein
VTRKLKIFFHDHCFDGASTAAIFREFYVDRIDPQAEVVYQGVQHQRGDPFADYTLDGDDNACVDFRYCSSPRMTWWFDHHISAFQPPDLKQLFDSDTSGQKFYDPTARSCAKFAAQTLADEFNYRPHDPEGAWAELVHWADIIDGAQFPNPQIAVELAEPALRLMTWVENNKDAGRAHQLIGELGRRPLAELAALPWVEEPLAPVLAEHRRHIDLIRRRAVEMDGVVHFDLSGDGVGAHNKFIAYMLFPQALYTVGVTRAPDRAKVSVGTNPWLKRTSAHNIARICERYGGGGHPVVGAVSLPPHETERARAIALEIVEELRDRRI